MEDGVLGEAPFATCRFDFDEAAFRDYYELHFRPHDKASGWKFMWLFFIVLLMYGAFLALLSWGLLFAKEHFRESDYPAYVLLVCIVVLLAWCASYGFRMWRGLRRPRWGRPRWDARTDAAFRMLADGPSDKPLAARSTCILSPMVVMPAAWLGSSWADDPLFYDAVPGLLPGLAAIDPRRGEGPPPRRAPFEARFYSDGLAKGSAKGGRRTPYSAVHDVVEDARFPDLAIVRLEGGAGEVVVRPSAFEGATWEAVKARVKRAKGWVTLREALSGKGRPEGKPEGRGGL